VANTPAAPITPPAQPKPADAESPRRQPGPLTVIPSRKEEAPKPRHTFTTPPIRPAEKPAPDSDTALRRKTLMSPRKANDAPTEPLRAPAVAAPAQAKPASAPPVPAKPAPQASEAKPPASAPAMPAPGGYSSPIQVGARSIKAIENAPTVVPTRRHKTDAETARLEAPKPPLPPISPLPPRVQAQPPALPPVGEETAEISPGPTSDPQLAASPENALEETQPMDPAEVERPPMIESESPRISFGQAALMLKVVTPAQIQECVNVQRVQMSKGQRVALLGQILLERGYLTKQDIEKIKSFQQVYQFASKIPGYQIVEKLGQGAMGAVFKARQLRMERWVAIKILQPELAANRTIKERFLEEARASARLNHPNVITGIDAGEINGLSYFAMEYIEGKTLQQLVRERGPMDERQALEVILQVAKALEHAEKHSLVHRDIKPDNIMVTRERVAKLLDLGLAKMRMAEDVGASKGMAVGTPNYISPEQAMGRQDIDTRADIYSLGVTLFYVLTGRVPFEGPPEVVMYRHIHEPPPHPRNFRPDLSEFVCTLLFGMMAKRAEDRPASAGQLVSDIEHLLRTGRLPGLFDGGAPQQIRVNKQAGGIVSQRRAPNLRGFGMPAQSAPQPPAPADDGSSARLPRKRRKNFGGW
jgi:serine/threonine-protein kinase